eukprot:CAMPEP_0175746074 /NCGR_PEP_ID=MMETSP0097-20121207/58404_1 /TAXON_ID=311494 /ORGANISM="Alexandrium monilatum, Strain CCMP3105" /LENGTH=402 /DNA_ID=CAMNT_0017054501 /DNA_START=1 /DNA_END=1206 /DNA_ORIENTATION=-
MLQARLLSNLGAAACASRRLRAVAEAAAHGTVLQVWPKACLTAGETWAVHWTLLSTTAHNPCARTALCHALYGQGDEAARGPAPPAATDEQVSGAERAVAVLVGKVGRRRRNLVLRLLGAEGGLESLPLQRRLLRRMCFDAGAQRQAPVLARLTVLKARGTGVRAAARGTGARAAEADALLDLAELLNLRAYMRTYVSRRTEAISELLEALAVAKRAHSLASSLRAGRLLGRTLASAAHALMLDVLDEETRGRLVQEWGGGLQMFERATQELKAGIATLQAAKDGERDALELGTTTASLGECWFCIAAAADHCEDTVLGVSAQGAAACSKALLQESIDAFHGANLTHTIEYADALKDLGKLLSCFDLGIPESRGLLTASLYLHMALLGALHPRTRNVVRLLE